MKRNILLTCLLLTPLFASAQTADKPGIPLPVWKAPLPSSQGAYTVALNAVCSVALENYKLIYNNSEFPVLECSIETIGGKTARFYYIEDNKDEMQGAKVKREKEDDGPLEQVKEAVSSILPFDDEEKESEDDKGFPTGTDKYQVVKAYPESALAHSVEYRLRSKSEVVNLYKSLRDAWVSSAP